MPFIVSSKLIIGVKHDVRKAGKHEISMKTDELRRTSGAGKTLSYWCYACNNYQPLLMRAAEKQIQLLCLTKYGLNYANM